MSHLVATVGSNPLAPMLAAVHHEPDRLTLVHTSETAEVASRVARLVAELDITSASAIQLVPVPARDPPGIAPALEAVDRSDLRLDVTGGTKTLSAETRAAFDLPAGHVTRHANGRIWTEVGGPAHELDPMRRAPSLDQMIALHGLRRWHPPAASRREADRSVLHDRLRLMPNKRPLLNGRTKGDKALSAAFERWVAECVSASAPSVTVQVGVYCYEEQAEAPRQRRECLFELDVVVHRGWRLGAISCGLGTSIEVDDKPLEVELHTARMGGDRAMSAAVAPWPDQTTKNYDCSTLSDIRRLTAVLAGGAPAPQLFGVKDIQDWLDDDDRPSLERWLTWMTS